MGSAETVGKTEELQAKQAEHDWAWALLQVATPLSASQGVHMDFVGYKLNFMAFTWEQSNPN